MMSFIRKPTLVAPIGMGMGLPVPSCGNRENGVMYDAVILRLRLVDSMLNRRDHQTVPGWSFCCSPIGCRRYQESPIRPEQEDQIRVVCSNPECSAGKWMHGDCFRDWEQLMVTYIRACGSGAVRDWNGPGLGLALRACSCICGQGYICKDLANPMNQTRKYLPQKSHHHHHHHHHYHQDEKPLIHHGQDEGRQKYDAEKNQKDRSYEVRVRTYSFSSTGSSPASSNATPPPTSPRRSDGNSSSIPSRSPTPTPEVTSTTGNIFRHRADLSAFRILPKTVRNPYHIKVEDDGPHGNDKIRSFLLTNLTRNQIREVHCSICECNLPIFDEFPLIDGTFFLSPRQYNDDSPSVVFERRLVYLNAVCLGCLDGTKTRLLCQGCLAPWDGTSLIIGTMYSYDVFGAMSCCSKRLSCTGCSLVIEDPQNLKFFSEYSRLVRCPHCQLDDYHFLKPLKDIFWFKTS